jgi:hypothetical protein
MGRFSEEIAPNCGLAVFSFPEADADDGWMGEPNIPVLIRPEIVGGAAAPPHRDCTRRVIWFGPEDSVGGSAKEATGTVVLPKSRS